MDDPAGSAFRRHYSQIFRYVRRRTSSDEQAEDLTQAVFADAAERLRFVSPGTPPILAWLYTVAQRRLVDHARRSARAPETIASLEDLRAQGMDEAYYGRAVAGALRDALEELPRGQREIVVMKLLEGRSFAEIARRVSASEGACKMRFARGLEAVREHLANRGVAP